MIRPLTLALALSAVTASIVQAQPRPPSPSPMPPPAPETPEKIRARALLKEGVRLANAGRKREALSLFNDAYAIYPGSTILLNIGAMHRELGDFVEAARTYQRFLDDPARATANVADAEAALLELDKLLTRVSLVVEPTDTTPVEIALDGGAWTPLPASGLVRVAPGAHRLQARGGGVTFVVETAIDAVAGVPQVVTLTMVAAPPPPPPPPPVEAPPPVEIGPPPPEEPLGITAPAAPRRPGRFGALVHVAIEGQGRGAAGSLGVTFAPHPRLTLSAGGMAGPSFGGFAAATLAILPGRVRPTLTGGVPVVVRDGTHVGVRGAAGVEWLINRRTSVIADVAAEYYPSPGEFYEDLMFTPTVGVHARL